MTDNVVCTCDVCRKEWLGDLSTGDVLRLMGMTQRELLSRGAPTMNVLHCDTPEKLRAHNEQVRAWVELQEDGGRVQ